jgi:Ca2+-binding RTX toxin-like protein
MGTEALNGTGNALANLLQGNGAANLLAGGSRADTLLGAADNDTLDGGSGDDSLVGGAGADHFVYVSATGSGTDVISDFNGFDGGLDEGDVLEFQGLLLGTLAYVGAGSFTGGNDNSEARFAGGAVYVDTNGNGGAEIMIKITGMTLATQMDASDFLWS